MGKHILPPIVILTASRDEENHHMDRARQQSTPTEQLCLASCHPAKQPDQCDVSVFRYGSKTLLLCSPDAALNPPPVITRRRCARCNWRDKKIARTEEEGTKRNMKKAHTKRADESVEEVSKKRHCYLIVTHRGSMHECF